jgi:alkanesulfonate monooxygenase SsuD/methylene tetrahydromethanopterin reductase-like flavin-dependent oxidoreductase (luciferase family)
VQPGHALREGTPVVVTTQRNIEFGVTFDFRNVAPEKRSLSDVYAETFELIALADELGLDHVYLTEHHFVDDGYCPSLLPLAAAVAARTRRIRISSYVFLLPLHHPLRVAEDVAVVDVISGGRMELGVGAGYRREEFEAFGVPRQSRRARMDEGCEILLRAWTEDGWSFEGTQYRLRNVSLRPKPLQKPHPPLLISARNPFAARRAGRFGTPLLIAPPPYVTDEHAVYAAYAEERRRRGHDPSTLEVGGSFNVIVTDDPEAYRARTGAGARHRADLYRTWYAEAGDIADDAQRISARRGRRTAVLGDAETCGRGLDEFLAGAVPYTRVIMAVEGAPELEAFATRVLPRYRT